MTIVVVDRSTGRRLASAVIVVRAADAPDEPPVELSPAGDGAWTFDASGSRRYVAVVGAFGYEGRSMSITGAAASPITVALTRAPLALPEVRATAERPSARTVHSLDRETQRLRGPDLGDWLRDLPGFDVVGRGPGGRTVATVRGSRPEAVEIMLDGVPLSDPLTGVADLSLVPAASLQSVTAMAGVGSAPGWGGTAGTIGLRSRETEPGARAGFGIGSFGRVTTEAGIGARTGVARVDAQLRYARARNDFAFDNRVRPGHPAERRVNADFSSWGGLARVSLEEAPVRLLARADVVERGAPGRMGTAVWDRARWEERAAMVGVAAGEVRDDGTARASLAWSGRRQVYADGRTDGADSLRADQIVAMGRERLPAGFGLSWRITWARVSGQALEEPSDRITGGLRAVHEAVLSSDWTLDVGTSVDFADVGVAVSPTLGLAWAVSDRTRAWARAGQGYRLPSFGDLFLRPGAGARPNPDLEPERVALDAELGGEVSATSGRIRVTGAAFYRVTLDPIIWLPSVVSVWSPINAGRLRAYGLEGSLAWVPREGWTLAAAGTLQASRLSFDGYASPLPYHPRVSGRVALERRGSGPDARVDLELRGTRRTSVYGPHELPPFALLGVRARQSFRLPGADAVLEIGVSNVLDIAYERVELFPEPGRSIELRLDVRPGRAASLPRAGADRSFPDREPDADGASSP